MSLLEEVRQERDRLLSATDKYALPDYPHRNEATRQAWLHYRRALRDITNTIQTEGDVPVSIAAVVWPVQPDTS